VEKRNRLRLQLEQVAGTVRLLDELLDNVEASGDAELDLCAELAAECQCLRPSLSALAADIDDKEQGLGKKKKPLFYGCCDVIKT